MNFAENLSDDALRYCGSILENQSSRKSIEKKLRPFRVPKIVVFGAQGGAVEGRECRRWIRRAILSRIAF